MAAHDLDLVEKLLYFTTWGKNSACLSYLEALATSHLPSRLNQMVISLFTLSDEDLNNTEIAAEHTKFPDLLPTLYVPDRIPSESYWNILLYFI